MKKDMNSKKISKLRKTTSAGASSSKSASKNVFSSDLLSLQNKIKRDPTSYKDEFLQAFHNYESTLQIYLMKPLKQNKQLEDSILFLANVSHCFPEELKDYAQQLIDILKKYATVLHPEMRMKLCRALLLIRNKNLILPLPLFELIFQLLKCQDKQLRKQIYTHMVNDCKKIKTKLKNYKQLSQLQQFVFNLSKDAHENVAKYALKLMIDLYKKQIWNDAKTVNIISHGCFSKLTKVLKTALLFFSSTNDEENKESDSEDDEKPTEAQIQMALRVGKKTKNRKKRSDRAMKTLKKEKKSKKVENYHFSALNLLYDPQEFAEKLLKQVESTNESFEIKLMMLDFIARLIGIHQLYLTNFYTFLIRFLSPHQREVAKMLWFAAISSHELVPPESIEQVTRTIANNFITERNSSEVIAVGINAVREICARCPLAMSEDLLGDLAQYKVYKEKAVSTAAKSLIQLYRLKNPKLLHRRDRGKPTDEIRELKVRKYGEQDVKEFVAGAEVIELDEQTAKGEEDEWEECSEGASESEEDDQEDDWVDVSNSSDEGNEDEQSQERKVEKLTVEEKYEKARDISSLKIFTQEDFKKIQKEQLRRRVEDSTAQEKQAAKRKHVQIDDSEDENAKNGDLVPLSAITHVNKKRRHDKEARVATVREGQKDRGKFGQKFKDSKLGKTNKEKRKTKSFQMIKHKLNTKHKRSFRDKQIALRDSLIKQKKMN